jgi:hypothetical protein
VTGNPLRDALLAMTAADLEEITVAAYRRAPETGIEGRLWAAVWLQVCDLGPADPPTEGNHHATGT